MANSGNGAMLVKTICPQMNANERK